MNRVKFSFPSERVWASFCRSGALASRHSLRKYLGALGYICMHTIIVRASYLHMIEQISFTTYENIQSHKWRTGACSANDHAHEQARTRARKFSRAQEKHRTHELVCTPVIWAGTSTFFESMWWVWCFCFYYQHRGAWKGFFFSRLVLDLFLGFLGLCFPVSLIFCFSASLLGLHCFSAFPAFLFLCFSVFLLSLLLCFFLLPCFSAFVFPASLLFCFCFPCFSAFVLCAFLLLLFYFFFSSVMFLFLCFFASCLYCLFVFHFLLLYSVLFVSQIKP